MSNEAARSADSFSPLVWFLIKKFISASGTICPQSFQTIDTVAMLNYQVQVLPINQFDLIFSFPSNTFEHVSPQNSVSFLLQTQSPLQSRTCEIPSLPPISVSVHLSFDFSLRTHHMGTYLVFTFQRISNSNDNDLLLLLYFGHCKVKVKYMLVIGRETFLLLFFRVKIRNPLGVLFICI